METQKQRQEKIALIDGDLILYKCGFANQTSSVTARQGGRVIGEFKNRTEALEFIKADGSINPDEGEIEFEDDVKAGNLIYAQHSVKNMIKNITKGAGCKSYRVYIDGKGNFRDNIATILPYKGNRKSGKPLLYNDLRQYLIKYHKAREVENIEADDAISIMGYKAFLESKGDPEKCRYVCCTIDKDAKNTPSLLYNWDKMEEPQMISELEAIRSFYKQVLIGDPVDNYRGCRGISERNLKLKMIDKLENERQMFDFCLDQYKAAEKKADEHRQLNKGKFKNFKPVENVMDEMVENARLAWMLREKPIWNSDGTLKNIWEPPSI